MARANSKRAVGVFAQIGDLPLVLLAFGVACASMFVPALYALIQDDHSVARTFFYAGVLGSVLFVLIGIALAGRADRKRTLSPLFALSVVMLCLPAVLALPFYEALRTTTYFNAYLEMVSAMTTTGSVAFTDPDRLGGALHLWRGQVAWLGGFVMWAAAAAILAPLNLGGFEVTARAEPGRAGSTGRAMTRAGTRARLYRVIGTLFPIYAGLTLALWIMLLTSAEQSLVALIHAMSIMSTSGLSPIGGLDTAAAGFAGEVVMFMFLAFAISRLTFSSDTVTQTDEGLHTDPEIRLATALIVCIPVLLFLRHWVGTFEFSGPTGLIDGLRALWGGVFTVASFLTTTGFTSAYWAEAQGWSGLGTPGLILIALALMGGGVATTAGGVKLLRVFALYRHGMREMEQLVHPSSVSGARGMGRRLQRQGAYIAWVFFMLFALSLAAICLLLTAFGVGFEDAMIMASAALSNTGPLLQVAGPTPIEVATLPIGAKLVFCISMVVGRLETLAVIALLTPELWRG
ncbi:MAG: TrkH family potassium uptake protein [Paracoccaceae bacterium]